MPLGHKGPKTKTIKHTSASSWAKTELPPANSAYVCIFHWRNNEALEGTLIASLGRSKQAPGAQFGLLSVRKTKARNWPGRNAGELRKWLGEYAPRRGAGQQRSWPWSLCSRIWPGSATIENPGRRLGRWHQSCAASVVKHRSGLAS